MDGLVTVTIPKRQELTPFKVGDKIMAGASTKKLLRRFSRIKSREMVCRMLKKKFEPIFIVVATNSLLPGQFNATLRPFNF